MGPSWANKDQTKSKQEQNLFRIYKRFKRPKTEFKLNLHLNLSKNKSKSRRDPRHD